MAKAAQKLALHVLKEECEALGERYSGYRVDAVVCLGEILKIEHNHPASVQRAVTDQLSHFGDNMGNKLRKDNE